MSIFRPKYIIDSIYNLKSDELNQLGIKAVFSDLDNTLIAWNDKTTIEHMDRFNQYLTSNGIKFVVVSNNSAERVGKVLNPINVDFVARAKKPLPGAIKKKVKDLGLTNHQVAMVGDQFITDIQSGNLAGVQTILVKPIVDTDGWNTRINRFFEKIIIRTMYGKKGIEYKGSLDEQR